MIAISLIGFYLAEKIEGLLDDLNVLAFLFYGIIVCITVSFVDIATDGWLVNMLDECYYGSGAAIMYIGKLVGRFIGFEIFV